MTQRCLVPLVFGIVIVGCGSADSTAPGFEGENVAEENTAAAPPSSEAEGSGEVLATVELGPDHSASFVEVEPGIVSLQEIAGEGAPDRLSVDELRALMKLSLPDQFERLAGDAPAPPALEAAEARRSELQSRIRDGQIAPPPTTHAAAPLIEKYQTAVIPWRYGVSAFYSTDCPSPAQFDSQWCFQIPGDGDVYSPGWQANTSFYRTSALNTGTRKLSHYVFYWDGSSWRLWWWHLHQGVDSPEYSMFVTDFPWTWTQFIGEFLGTGTHGIVVRDFE